MDFFYKQMKKILLLFLLFFLQGSPAFSQISKPTEFIPQAFDILHYDVWLDLTKGMEKFIAGKSKMIFVVKENPLSACLYFHLRDLTIDSAFFDDTIFVDPEPQTDSEIDYLYYKICNLPGSINDTHSVTVYYSGYATNEGGENPFGGVFLLDSILFANGVGFRNDYVSTTQHWLACYDHPSDKATYRISFRIPSGLTIATNGITKFIKRLDDGSEIWETNSRFPIATYLLTFALGPFIEIQPGYEYLPESLIYSIFCTKKDSLAVQWAFRNFYHNFFAMQNRWGRYPFEKIGYVVVPFERGAMEHQTMITFPSSVVNDLFNERDTLNLMACHEFAHQWFGNSVSPVDFRDVWFNESFATYSESILYELIIGKDAYFRKLLFDKDIYIRQIIGFEGALPLYNFPRKYPSSNYPSTIYYKGSVVIGMLRYHLGDDVFFDMMRYYLDSNAYTSKSTEDFVNFCESFSQEDLQWFFNQWIYGKGYPNFDIKVQKTKISENFAKVRLRFRQIQPKTYGSYLNVPVEINFLLSDSSRFDTVVVVPNVECEIELDSIPDFVSIGFNGGKKVVGLYTYALYLNSEDENQNDNFRILWQNDTKTVLITFPNEEECLISIFDLFGRIHYIEKHNPANNNPFLLNFSMLPKGIYFVQLITNHRKKIEQILNF